MKKILVLLLCAAISLPLAACTPSQEPSSGTDSVGSLSMTDTNSVQSTDSNTVQSTNENSTQSANTDSAQSTDTNTEDINAINLELKYDDLYEFPDKIQKIETLTVDSLQTGTTKKDTQVLKKRVTSPKVAVAGGCGTARVTLESGEVYKVTVSPATISVLLIIGQSNAEGSTTADNGLYATSRMNSILCDEGQVYSTYAWSTSGHSLWVAGLNSKKYLTESNANSFVAKTLTTSTSWAGNTLEYSLDALTKSGSGKTGFDSGLAWKWNQLTGEKVWVVNCAAGSTMVEDWVPGATRYKNCVALVSNVNKTMEAEISAGHYKLNHFAYFWLQGESNCNDEAETYDYYFSKMHAGLMQDLRMPGDKAPEYCGIIIVRAYGASTYEGEVQDNGVRTAQKNAAAATTGVYSNVFLACQDNDLWISDKAVTEYWETRYPNGVRPYPVRSGGYDNPTKVPEVHYAKTHYLQPGYNEIGLVAAEAAVKLMYNK